MSNRIRFGLAAGGLAIAALVVAAATTVPASALPPPGDPPDQPDQPTPTRPPRPPITATPPPTIPRVLQSLVVTTDSVVATAQIHYHGAPGVVTVDWQDGSINSRDPNAPVDSPRPNPNPDPPGVITFRHAYAPPSDGRAFGAQITARIGAESQTAAVVVTPRYRVTQYQASLTPTVACDSWLEQYTEWRVERSGASLAGKTWEFDLEEPTAWVGDYPGGTYSLPDSIVSFEGTVDQAGSVVYKVTELDPFFDQIGSSRSIDLDPLLGSRSVVVPYTNFSATGNCNVDIRADVNVTLLKPGLGGGPVAHQ
jgi:hypothetical protein